METMCRRHRWAYKEKAVVEKETAEDKVAENNVFKAVQAVEAGGDRQRPVGRRRHGSSPERWRQ